MPKIIEKYSPSVILCSYSKKLVKGNLISATKKLLNESVKIAKSAQISKDKIVVDPSIGFFRRSSDVKNKLPYTKIDSDWVQRDIEIIKKLKFLKTNFPILISISNKSFIGKSMEILFYVGMIVFGFYCLVTEPIENVERDFGIRRNK
mgnify:CR=1 FL=1